MDGGIGVGGGQGRGRPEFTGLLWPTTLDPFGACYRERYPGPVSSVHQLPTSSTATTTTLTAGCKKKRTTSDDQPARLSTPAIFDFSTSPARHQPDDSTDPGDGSWERAVASQKGQRMLDGDGASSHSPTPKICHCRSLSARTGDGSGGDEDGAADRHWSSNGAAKPKLGAASLPVQWSHRPRLRVSRHANWRESHRHVCLIFSDHRRIASSISARRLWLRSSVQTAWQAAADLKRGLHQ
ncbi:hypothetical protein HDK77DRAFT_109168 [Phyllosticta capitalensis]